MKGSLLIVSAPSGTGKTTILRTVMQSVGRLAFSVSHTTRPRREGEENGRDYHFVNPAKFEEIRQADGFLEWAEVHGNFYGTGRQQIEDQLNNGLDVVLDIDVQGAEQIRKANLPNARFVFIVPPSLEELARRLNGRGTDSTEVIELRLANARQEMKAVSQYDCIVVNDQLDRAIDMLRAIVLAERSRTQRDADGNPVNLKLAET